MLHHEREKYLSITPTIGRAGKEFDEVEGDGSLMLDILKSSILTSPINKIYKINKILSKENGKEKLMQVLQSK